MKLYSDIPGWFSEEAFYWRMVAEAHHGAQFVEIGCWLGKSTAWMASSILTSKKRIDLCVYDTFAGSENEPALLEAAKQTDVFAAFQKNMAECGFLFDVVAPGAERRADRCFHVTRIDSVKAAALHQDGSVDFAFIDACHTYAAVKSDIAAWRPKIKAGGILAGHDWNVYADVRRAVTEAWGKVETEGNCWIVRM